MLFLISGHKYRCRKSFQILTISHATQIHIHQNKERLLSNCSRLFQTLDFDQVFVDQRPPPSSAQHNPERGQ